MENNVTPSKSYLQFGVFFGLAMVLSFVLIYTMNINPIENPIVGTISSLLNYLGLPVLLIYLGCAGFKKDNNGFISLPESLKVGVSIAFVGALIFAVFNVVFNLIFPEYMEQIMSQSRQIMLKQNPNLTNEQVEMGISMAKKLSSPFFSVPLMLIIFSFLGLIYSLVIGLILKKDRPQFN
jgi:hypothetical protein